MALVDYERAWHELATRIAEKPHHGSRDLLAEMSRITASCRDEKAAQIAADQDRLLDDRARLSSIVMGADPDHRQTQSDPGGHDGYENGNQRHGL